MKVSALVVGALLAAAAVATAVDAIWWWPFNPCPGIVIVCNETGWHRAVTESGCNTCIQLPPKGKYCPLLTSCRINCTLTELDNKCAECRECSERPADHPAGACDPKKCAPGAIQGNPDEKDCDTCIGMPVPTK